MKVDQLILSIGELKFIEVHKIEWINIQKIPHKFYPVREVGSSSIIRDGEVLKTKRSLFGTKIRKEKGEVTDYIPLIILDEVLSYDYSLNFRGDNKVFRDDYSYHYIGEHCRELNGSTEIVTGSEIKDYEQGSALEKLKTYLSNTLVGADHELFEYEDKLRLRVGPHMRIQFNDNQVAVFNCKTNGDLIRKARDLSTHPELIHFY